MVDESLCPEPPPTCSPLSPRDKGTMLYMAELGQEDLKEFKRLLASKLNPEVSDSGKHLDRASWAEVVHFLTELFPGPLAWEVTENIFSTMAQKEMCTLAQEELSGLRQTLEPEQLDSTNAPMMTLKKEEVDKIQEYKRSVQEACSPPWDPTAWPGNQADFLYQDSQQLRQLLACLLLPQKPQGTQPRTVVVQGVPGMGKTILAKQVMWAWARGEFYPHRVWFAFYLPCQELKLEAQHSLSELLRQTCQASRALVSKVLSRPRRLLLVLDGFEELDFSSCQRPGELTDDCNQKVSGQVLLSSLLGKKMLPEATLLLLLRPISLTTMEPLLIDPTVVTLTGFGEGEKIQYFRSYFANPQDADRAVSFAMKNGVLFSLCRVPSVCWLVCRCLKEQMQKQASLEETCPNAAAVIALALSTFFQTWTKAVSRQTRLQRLEVLCQLAAHSMWRIKPTFGSRELGRDWVSKAGTPTLLRGHVLRTASCGTRFAFTLPVFQEFFAALFYVLFFPQRLQSHHHVGRMQVQYLMESPGGDQNPLASMGLFLFGLLNSACISVVEGVLGCRLGTANKAKVLRVVSRLPPPRPCCGLPQVFYCLAEMLEDPALRQELRAFQKLLLKISSYEDLQACALGLTHCKGLKEVELRLLFSSCSQPGPRREEPLPRTKLICSWWQEICRTLGTHQGLEALTLANSVVDSWFMEDLATGLTRSSCRVQRLCPQGASENGTPRSRQASRAQREVLRPNQASPPSSLRRLGRDLLPDALFQALIENHHLKVLEIERTEVGLEATEALCEVLKSPKCYLSGLRLGYCQVSASTWDKLARDLQSNQFLKTLLLHGSSLAEGGAAFLAIGHLRKLALEDCGLTEALAAALALRLRHNQQLTHLSLAENPLADAGGKLIWEALENLESPLRRLVLRNCALTSACCPEMTSALKRNKTLQSLELGCNKLGNVGIKMLCEALLQLSCNLQVLELENCLVTSTGCQALATVFRIHPSLQHLDLSHNDIGIEGMLALHRAFSSREDREPLLL
ncbi:NACHT, LRR and PYD domains-containing protein 8 [Thomomys bottae]